MSRISERMWGLDRYARYIHSDSGGRWKQQDDSNQPLMMAITAMSQLVIMQDSTVLESHNLANAQTWMRGVGRGDSLLFIYRLQTYTRRFRVRFCQQDDKTGDEVCNECVQYLHKFFPIKVSSAVSRGMAKDKGGKSDKNQVRGEEITVDNTTTASGSSRPTGQSDSALVKEEPQRRFDHDCITLQGEIPMNKMAETVLGGRYRSLPLAYQQLYTDTNLMPEILRLSLADPAFPVYFEKVQAVLTSMADG